MSILHNEYELLANLLADANPKELLKFKVSEEMGNRYLELSEKHKDNTLSIEEEKELHDFLALNRIVSLAKVKAESSRN